MCCRGKRINERFDQIDNGQAAYINLIARTRTHRNQIACIQRNRAFNFCKGCDVIDANVDRDARTVWGQWLSRTGLSLSLGLGCAIFILLNRSTFILHNRLCCLLGARGGGGRDRCKTRNSKIRIGHSISKTKVRVNCIGIMHNSDSARDLETGRHGRFRNFFTNPVG